MKVHEMDKKILITAFIFALSAVFHSAQAVCIKDGYCDRPIKMGVSIGNTPSAPFIYTGTAGMRVYPFGSPGLKLILSNNHVLGAVGPDLCPNTADGFPPPVTWALQPGTLDIGFDPGNDPAYLAGVVFRYVPIDFTPGAQNKVDAAAAITTTSLASSEILGLGFPNKALGTPTIGMAVTKSGRTTGVTTGTVLAVNSTVNVNYGDCGTATFVGQVITSASLGDSGDSGSIVLEQGTNTPVGLYFAGSSFTGVMNPILEVYLALRVFIDVDTGSETEISSVAELQQQAARIPVDARIKALKLIQARHQARLLSVHGVRGVGIGKNETGDGLALMVFCEKLTDKLRKSLPAEIEGARVRLIETGRFVAH
jgi:hypothetical protein